MLQLKLQTKLVLQSFHSKNNSATCVVRAIVSTLQSNLLLLSTAESKIPCTFPAQIKLPPKLSTNKYIGSDGERYKCETLKQ